MTRIRLHPALPCPPDPRLDSLQARLPAALAQALAAACQAPADLPTSGELDEVPEPTLWLVSRPADLAGALGLAGIRDEVLLLDELLAAPDTLDARLARLAARARLFTLRPDASALDEISGLLGRGAWLQRAAAALERLPLETVAGVLVIDIDHFRAINERLGHAGGDRILAEVGQALHGLIGPEDLAARLGADVFALLLLRPSLGRLRQAADVVREEIASLAIPTRDGLGLSLTASVGVALAPPGLPLDGALQAAEAAMQGAREAGGHRVQFHAHQQRTRRSDEAGGMREDDAGRAAAPDMLQRVSAGAQRLLGKLGPRARPNLDVDALTGGPSRHYFDRRLEREIALARRDGRPLSIALLDPDAFAAFNARWGLDGGDDALRGLVTVAQARLRPTDVLARHAGATFALLLPEPATGACEAVERLRRALDAEPPRDADGQPRSLAWSAGVATLGSDVPDLPALVQAAQSALQQAKRGGGGIRHADTARGMTPGSTAALH